MKRPLKPEELRVWSMVAATVHPLPQRNAAKPARPQTLDAPARIEPHRPDGERKTIRYGVDGIEPNRRHRIPASRVEGD